MCERQVSPMSGGASDESQKPCKARRWTPRRLTEDWASMRSFPTHNEGGEHRPVLVDADAMKMKVRQNIQAQKANVGLYYKSSGFCQAVARNAYFETLTLFVIGLNAIWIWVDIDNNPSELVTEAPPLFFAMDNCFCLFFCFEIAVRFGMFRKTTFVLKDAWFLFDFSLVCLMVTETWVLYAVIKLSGQGDGGGEFGNTSVLRIVRLIRLARMARMARVIKALPELMILVKGLKEASRAVFFTLCLLILLMYVFALTFTQLLKESELGGTFFSDVGSSMYTLLVYGALLDQVGVMLDELGSLHAGLGALFLLFVLLASLTVLNLLIGVLCEVVSAVAACEREELLVCNVHGKLHKVISMLDSNGDMMISKKEFLSLLENEDASRTLHAVGVDVVGLVDFADFIFEEESAAASGVGAERELTFSAFMEVVLALRGTNNSTVKDIVDLRKFVRNAFADLNKELKALAEQVQRLTTSKRGHRTSSKTHQTGTVNASETEQLTWTWSKLEPLSSASERTSIEHDALSVQKSVTSLGSQHPVSSEWEDTLAQLTSRMLQDLDFQKQATLDHLRVLANLRDNVARMVSSTCSPFEVVTPGECDHGRDSRTINGSLASAHELDVDAPVAHEPLDSVPTLAGHFPGAAVIHRTAVRNTESIGRESANQILVAWEPGPSRGECQSEHNDCNRKPMSAWRRRCRSHS